MSSLSRIWNGRVTGLPGAAWLALSISVQRIGDRISTILARGNLGSMGRGTIVQRGVVIRHPGRVHVGERSSLATGIVIDTELPDGECRIGNDVIIWTATRLDFSGGLTIGDGVVISEDVVVYTHAHGLEPKSIPHAAPLVIENGVWLGSRVVVTEGCDRIGAGSVVASGSVVTREVPPGVLVAGIPARVVKAIELAR